MKVFFCANQETINHQNWRLLSKAIATAKVNAGLDPYLIFDGDLNHLPESFFGIKILNHTHRLSDVITSSKLNISSNHLRIMKGTYLRTEIPYLCMENGIFDDYVLYADIDVIFMKGDYSVLDGIKPRFIAVAPEVNKDDWSYFNAGIMLMNLDGNFLKDDEILRLIKENINEYDVFDQTMYNKIYSDSFDRLPLEFNWKCYWGINDDARIIHYHGAKPRAVEGHLRYNLDIVKEIRNQDISSYEYYNSIWNNMPDL